MIGKIKKYLAWNLPFAGKHSQSYEGEDVLLWRLFTEEIPTTEGFFIDVGAFHPVQYNNTWMLRKRLGFTGINIEPQKEGIKQFNRWRKDDVNLCTLIGSKDGTAFFKVNEDDPALSEITDVGYLREIHTLETICKYHLVDNIDLLSVDVEGYELSVLLGHNWERIKPKAIICEINEPEVHKFIIKQGYNTYARTKRNGIYVREGD